MLIRGIFY